MFVVVVVVVFRFFSNCFLYLLCLEACVTYHKNIGVDLTQLVEVRLTFGAELLELVAKALQTLALALDALDLIGQQMLHSLQVQCLVPFLHSKNIENQFSSTTMIDRSIQLVYVLVYAMKPT